MLFECNYTLLFVILLKSSALNLSFTKQDPEETGFFINGAAPFPFLDSDEGNMLSYASVCLPQGFYYFELYDTYGDGMSEDEDGGYVVKRDGRVMMEVRH